MIRFVVDLAIKPNDGDKLEGIVQAMIAGCRNELGTLGYDWFVSSDRRRCRLIETYTDANAVVAHLTGPVVQELVPKLRTIASVDGFEVYGDPGAQAAKMLTGIGAEIFEFWHGLDR